MMRILTILVLLAAAIWGGWWVIGSRLLDRGLTAGIASARADGWQVSMDDLSISGFPNRFDTYATGLEVAAPDRLWGVALPFLQVFALSYRPNHLIVVPAPEATVSTPVGPVSITADDLRASATVLVSGDGLSAATGIGQGVVASGPDWLARLASGQVAMRQAGPDAYDLALMLIDLTVDGSLPDPRLPDHLTSANLDLTVTLDRPAALGGQPVAATLRRMEVAWDDSRIDLTGTVQVTASGQLQGDLLLAVTGWRDLLDLAQQYGLPQGQMLLLAGGLGGLDQDGTATLPLTLRGGQILFGSIPLATLPRFAAR